MIEAMPELKLLLWDTNRHTLSRLECFQYYESRMGFIGRSSLTKDEAAFIKSLCDEFGPTCLSEVLE